jgi:cytochrome c-type biogenesis protein CcmH
VALAMAVPVLAIALYALLGEPRVLQEPAFRDDMRLETLARHVAAHPDDARALTLLGRELAAADRFAEAAGAFERAVQSPKVARDATVWAEYADALAMAQGRTLQGRPSQLIAKALALDPRHPQALEMAGSAAFERHDYTAAAQHWRTLLAELPADSNSTDELRRALEETERLARTTLPVSSPR